MIFNRKDKSEKEKENYEALLRTNQASIHSKL